MSPVFAPGTRVGNSPAWLRHAPFAKPKDPAAVAPLPTWGPYRLDRDISQFNMRASSPEAHPELASPSEDYFISGFYPQTPTLSIPDTPTTAGLGSSAPPTPNTPSFGPPTPAYTRNKKALNVPGSPRKALLPPDNPRFGFEIQSRPADLWNSAPVQEDEGQELVIPSSCSEFRQPPQVALAPPPAVSNSLNKLRGGLGNDSHGDNARQETCDAEFGLHTNADDAYTSKISCSTTILDESLDLGMFEMVTPADDESAPAENPELRTMPSDDLLRAASPSANALSAARSASDDASAAVPSTPSAPSPFLRRHRPPPLSVLQELNSLANRIRGFRRNAPSAPASESTIAHGERVVESPSHTPTNVFESTINTPAGSSGWFPPSGPGSPPRFFSESPVPLTLSAGEAHESATSGELRRHRPRSIRSISLIDLGESLITQPSHGSEGDSGIEFVDRGQAGREPEAGRRPRVNEEVVRGHRRQLALSFSFQTFEEVELSAARESFFAACRQQDEADNSPQETLTCWPSWEARAEQKLAEGEAIAAPLSPGEQKRRKMHAAKAGGFWKKVGSSVGGLLGRHGKAGNHDATPWARPKGGVASLGRYFGRRGPIAPANPWPAAWPSPAAVSLRDETWPSAHRRTPGCSDPTCMFHPRRVPKPALGCAFGSGFELGPGNDEGTFLRELGDWGHDAAPGTAGLEAAPNPKRVEGTRVREEGERMLRGILSISGGQSVVSAR